MRRERIHVWKSARESAMVFLEDEKVRLYALLEVECLTPSTREAVLDCLDQLEKE